ncbi:4571_t:CDS:2, partial [Ambispora gerdemannii]
TKNIKYYENNKRLYGTKGYGSIQSKKDNPESRLSQGASGRRESILEKDEKEKDDLQESKSPPGSNQQQQEQDPEDVPTVLDSQAPAASESSEPSEIFDPVKKKFVPVSEERYKNKTEENKEVNLGGLSDGHTGAASSNDKSVNRNNVITEKPTIQSGG